MKISNDTMSILKNYAGINSNLLIKEGNEISTISSGQDILARATVKETFPQDIAIYDLQQFLGTLSIVDDSDVEFGTKSLQITSNQDRLEYFYADPTLIKAVPDKVIMVDNHFQFTLTVADITMIMKAAAIFSAPVLSVVSDGGAASLVVSNPAIPSSNNYKRELGPCEHDFDFRLQIENLKLVPDTYLVTLSKKKFMHFKSSTLDLQYWLAVDPNSKV